MYVSIHKATIHKKHIKIHSYREIIILFYKSIKNELECKDNSFN